ncbi:threonine synthase [Brockia lithotrophica]|uniref:Threonine synthase n=1 Tax=Brockia lithotrophica TaxID=933949 RepID=A0A660LBS8_9BACL|nr:threonine synthase [Brockia lithotrophica]RKQ89070.1 threonine synthase [Brockia lithotrophica]
MWTGILDAYGNYLPLTERTPRLSLGEGNTPLVALPRLGARLDVELYAKLEGLNPTGSFKDRGMVVAVAKALEEGKRAVICASTGNTAASAAAYAARAGIRSFVVVPKGYVAVGKLVQAVAFGAAILEIEGNFDAGLHIVRRVAERESIALVNSVNPYRLEGQKTAAFEIVDALGDAPDVLALPVGNAGNISAYWMGFTQYPKALRRPRLLGVQAEGAAPIVRGAPVERPETVATAIRIGHPASWDKAVRARDESGGRILAVSDAEILDAYRALAREEGVFVEPASAAPIAGLFAARRDGWLPRGIRVVAVLTGNGLKDPDTALSAHVPERIVLPADEEAVVRTIARALGS